MKILHVDPERHWGGGEVQVAALLKALARLGHRSTLAAPPEAPLARVAAAEGIPVVPLRIRNHADLPAALRLRRLAHGYDVVHFHTARAHALAPVCRGLGARLVVTRRMDYRPRGGVYARWLYGRVTDVVIAISRGVCEALLAAGVPPARVRLVPSGIDPQALVAPPGARDVLRSAWRATADEVVVLAIGALVRRKGHDLLLDATARAGADIRFRVVLCGDGPEAGRLRERAARLGVPLVLTGFRRDVAACLAAADIVAMPSRQEGLGVAALESMAAGKPLVATRVGGLGEVVRPEETGLLVPAEDVPALAAALARVASDPMLRGRLGAAARAHVLASYTADRMAAGTVACYQGEPWPG